MVAALLILARRLEMGRGAAWARLGSAGAIASLAVAAAVQAVDGAGRIEERARQRVLASEAAPMAPTRMEWRRIGS